MNQEYIKNLLYSIHHELNTAHRNHSSAKYDLTQILIGLKKDSPEFIIFVSNYVDSLTQELTLLEEAYSVLIITRRKFRWRSFFTKLTDKINNVPDLRPLSRIIDQLIERSRVSSRTFFQFLAEIFRETPNLFVLWQKPLDLIGTSIMGMERVGHLINEIELINLESELELPNQNWRFITDENLRLVLARDYDELGKLLKIKARKSSLVMCGSILEAVLVAVLGKNEEQAQAEFKKIFSKSANTKLERWNLFQLITIAEKLELLDDDTRRHADIVRDYRNLIHPSSEVRRKTKIDDELIAAEVALLKRILRILSAS